MNDQLTSLLRRQVMLLDGSMGVMIQHLGLTEEDFRGERFRDFGTPDLRLKGNNDLLVLTRPEAIAKIHRDYLVAGADIIETNSFNSNALSQREYQMTELVDELNFAAAQLARREADRYMAEHPGAKKFVAGSVGPTSMSASLSSDVNDPSKRAVTFDELRTAYAEQCAALIRGGVDLLIIETAFDALNAKAALLGAHDAMEALSTIPVIVSGTISDASGRILSGHNLEAFLATIAFARPAAFGLNCSAGPEGLIAPLRRLAEKSPFPTIVYPNAGLPDDEGRYSATPESFAAVVKQMLDERIVNIVGGCCGTTPEHIARLRELLDARPEPRQWSGDLAKVGWLAGLDAFNDGDDRGFINVGERCNVAGSRKFLRLVKEGSWDEACAIARKQVEDGAQVLDINMDDSLLPTRELIVKFLRLLGADPVTASVPWMIDSSDFGVIEEALKAIPGKAIVNSISLKKGEEEFLRQARVIREYGCAVVVMAFDEQGQADTYERKIEICERAFKLLVNEAGFEPRDIIFDPNVLTIATGMAEHDAYARDYIRAVEWIHANLRGAKTSGGVSNLSFSFRGNNFIRQALHAVFLYHAIRAGLSMAIIDPSAKVTYGDIPSELLAVMEDVIFNRSHEASERLTAMAADYAANGATGSAQPDAAAHDIPADVNERLRRALIKGDDSTLAADLDEALPLAGSAVALVEGVLMEGMERVGELFEKGKLFLPQVVKSARIMHKAVELLRPALEAHTDESAKKKGVFLVATVKGDVHDIGKNIVSVVMRCNNFEVIDLGVQVDSTAIVEAAKRCHPDFIGLSGLITPSLEEMRLTVIALEKAGIRVPVFVGGAATSALHTALRIAPEYGGVVVRVNDAAQNPVIASRLMTDAEAQRERILAEQEALRQGHDHPAAEPASDQPHPAIDWDSERANGAIVAPTYSGCRRLEPIAVEELLPYINWRYFFSCWRTALDSPQAAELRADAERMLGEMVEAGATVDAAVGFFDAYTEGDDMIIEPGDGRGAIRIAMERQRLNKHRHECLSLADFVAPAGYGDHVGAFMITIGERARQFIDEARRSGDDYRLLLAQSLGDRLVEAASEMVHYRVRRDLWGYAPDEALEPERLKRGQYGGIRPAIGYPSLSDQRLMFELAKLVDPRQLEVEVTENGALSPSSTVAGFYLASPHARYFTIE